MEGNRLNEHQLEWMSVDKSWRVIAQRHLVNGKMQVTSSVSKFDKTTGKFFITGNSRIIPTRVRVKEIDLRHEVRGREKNEIR